MGRHLEYYQAIRITGTRGGRLETEDAGRAQVDFEIAMIEVDPTVRTTMGEE